MNRFKKVLIILGITSVYILAFTVIDNLRLFPTNIYSNSANLAIGESLRQGASADAVTFTDVFKKSPYCLIDPTCVNFITNDGMALWQYEFRGSIGMDKFAWPNALLFMLLVAGMLYTALSVVGRKQKLRRGVVAIAVGFASLEVIRWFAEAESYESSDLRLFSSYMLCVALMLFMIRLVTRKFESEKALRNRSYNIS